MLSLLVIYLAIRFRLNVPNYLFWSIWLASISEYRIAICRQHLATLQSYLGCVVFADFCDRKIWFFFSKYKFTISLLNVHWLTLSSVLVITMDPGKVGLKVDCLVKNSSSKTIDSLPDEVLDYVLSLVSTYGDLRASFRVCRRWRNSVQRVAHNHGLSIEKAMPEMRLIW